jgi:hypothetical protein
MVKLEKEGTEQKKKKDEIEAFSTGHFINSI